MTDSVGVSFVDRFQILSFAFILIVLTIGNDRRGAVVKKPRTPASEIAVRTSETDITRKPLIPSGTFLIGIRQTRRRRKFDKLLITRRAMTPIKRLVLIPVRLAEGMRATRT